MLPNPTLILPFSLLGSLSFLVTFHPHGQLYHTLLCLPQCVSYVLCISRIYMFFQFSPYLPALEICPVTKTAQIYLPMGNLRAETLIPVPSICLIKWNTRMTNWHHLVLHLLPVILCWCLIDVAFGLWAKQNSEAWIQISALPTYLGT
jgi:hypothetical protein